MKTKNKKMNIGKKMKKTNHKTMKKLGMFLIIGAGGVVGFVKLQLAHQQTQTPMEKVDIIEIMAYITDWKAGSVTIENLMIGIGEWKNGC